MMLLFQFYIDIFIYKFYYSKHISLKINNYRIPFNKVTVVLVLPIFVKLNIESLNLQN